jgi:glycosyltransferase involved in cell wall biosynthesis
MRERWYYLRRLYGLAGLERADVYHFEFGGLAAYFLDVLDLYRPCVVSLRGSDISIYPLGNPEYAQNLKQALSLADKIHCVSQAVQREAASLLGSLEKMFVNYPSVDTAFFSPLDVPRQGNLVVTVSRFHWKKSLPTALMAVALLRRDCPDVRYVLVGDGTLEERTELAFHVHDLGIAEHVEFHGPASAEEVRELLAQASVFVLPSVSEGLPNSVLEAMAMEVPVVVTDAGGMPEAVADGVEGFVVPRRDYRALAEKIETLLRNPGLAREMGKKGRERVLRQFTLERQIETFLRVYQELAQHGR